MSNDNKPQAETGRNVSSGFFSYRKNHSPPSTTPVLIDNLSLRVRIATAMPEAGHYPADDIPKRRFLGPEHLASAFANPFIYPAQRGRPCLKLFGQHSLRTNGRRIYRHVIGDPLPHKTGHDDKILREDKQHNQLEDVELAQVIELAQSANQNPYTWQLTRMMAEVFTSYSETMTNYGLEIFNPPENYRRYFGIERLEAYFEVIGFFDYYEVTQALQKVLYRYFRASDKRRHRFEKSSDKADQDTYTTWVISPELVSSEFSKGRDDFKVKVYRKFDRVRVEIQANFPKLKEPNEWDGSENPFFTFAGDVLRVSNILNEKLQLIRHEVFGTLEDGTESIDLMPPIARRLKELRPTKSTHVNFDKVVHHLATYESITLKDLEVLGWSRNDINIMANKQFGFLTLKPAGIDVRTTGKKRIVKGVYVLVRDWLNRTGKPSQKQSKPRKESQTWSIESWPRLARIRNGKSIADDLEGSALDGIKPRSAFRSA